MLSKTLTTTSAEQTIKLASKIGVNLKGGECIELVSDVGGGKTTFVKGLVKGAGSKSHVSSPTFSISKQYHSKKFEIIHFDFYRLAYADLIEYEVQEAVDDENSVIVVEWSNIIKHVLPDDRLRINITAINEEERIFELKLTSKYIYLLEGIV